MSKFKPIKVQKNSADEVQEMRKVLELVSPAVETATPVVAVTAKVAAAQVAASPGSVADWVVGATVSVPLTLLDESQYNAREFYSNKELDEMAESLRENGQEVPVSGWVRNGRVVVNDGQKRLRGARLAVLPDLRVELTVPPATKLEEYERSCRLNSERSRHSALDNAVKWQRLITEGILPSQDDLAKHLKLKPAVVSQVLSINLIPPVLMNRMKEDPRTSSLRAAYQISRVFKELADDLDRAGELAEELIDRVIKKEMTSDDLRHLVDSKIKGKSSRTRSIVEKITFGGREGHLKTVPSRGLLTLHFENLTAAEIDEVTLAVKSLGPSQLI